MFLESPKKSVLQKGLTFSLLATLDKFTLIKDLYFFCSNLTFKLLYSRPTLPAGVVKDDRLVFQDLLDLLQENELWASTSKSTFRPRSKSLPPAIQTFFNVIKKEIMHLPQNKHTAQNLTSQERDAIKQLHNNTQFTIKEADKGSKVVLWPIDLYVKEVL